MMKIKKLLSAALSSVILTGSLSFFSVHASSEDNTMRDMTTMDIVNDMGMGINLGNTFESCGDWITQWGESKPSSFETAWGSPIVTEQLIQGYKKAGYDSLRIPVAWSNMMANDGQYKIHPDYLARVTEVVDWALDADLYVIINLHWDSGWLEKVPTEYDECIKKYTAIWNQISDAYRDYGDYLIFESQNEELGWSSVWNPWGGTQGKEESFNYANSINQTFVDIVRSSGGNNEKRHLLISGYNTNIGHTCDPLFKMPEDPANRCAVSVHYYDPAGFAILTEDADWGKASPTWGTEEEYAYLNEQMDMLKTTFVDKGIPVIIGEYGCPKENKEEDSVRKFLTAVCEASLSRGGICPVLWDITNLHYDRQKYEMIDKQLQSEYLAIKEKYTAKDIAGDVTADGKFDLADIVMMQKWLLGKGEITDWKAGDMNKDNFINIYDLCLMKRNLINQ
jgi:endoglucanase